MARKKKDMNGGRLFGILSNKPISTQKYNTYLTVISNLDKKYKIINKNTSVNNLNTKVKSLKKFSNKIKEEFSNKNKKELVQLLTNLEELKRLLIQKLFEKLEKKYNILFQNDSNLFEFSELLSILQDFEKLSDLIISLGGEREKINPIKIRKNEFIAKMLDKYEKEIISRFQKNKNSGRLIEEIENYIKIYSEFVVSITKRGQNNSKNNSINTIIRRLSELLNNISEPSRNNGQNSPHLKGNHQNNSQSQTHQQFRINNRSKELENQIKDINNQGFKNRDKIKEKLNEIFVLLLAKFNLAIQFLDTLGNQKRITKHMNNSLVNNAVYENKDLAKNIRSLYDLWVKSTNKYSYIYSPNEKSKLEEQESLIEEKKQEYSQKMFEKQKYVNYIE